jgi:hypothetical protein
MEISMLKLSQFAGVSFVLLSIASVACGSAPSDPAPRSSTAAVSTSKGDEGGGKGDADETKNDDGASTDAVTEGFPCEHNTWTMCVKWNPSVYLYCDGQQWRDIKCTNFPACNQQWSDDGHVPC